MKTLIALISIIPLLITTAAVADKHEHKHDNHKREHGAHEHGHGTLNISTEGKIILLELEVPAADIYGFEHKAENDEQKQIIQKASIDLQKPLGLFDLGSEADCKVENVKLEDGQDKAGEHSEVHVEYALYCKNPGKITSINLKYFERFKGAEELKINIIGSQGQKSYEVERDKPVLKLGGSL